MSQPKCPSTSKRYFAIIRCGTYAYCPVDPTNINKILPEYDDLNSAQCAIESYVKTNLAAQQNQVLAFVIDQETHTLAAWTEMPRRPLLNWNSAGDSGPSS